MDFQSLVKERRSCRNYDKTKKVPSDVLERIVDAALLSPSACNSQPWFVHYTNKAELCDKIATATQDMGFNKFASGCTAFAVISQQKPNLTEKIGVSATKRDFVGNDIGLLTAHMTLAAKAEGVDTCILGLFNEKKLNEALELNADNKIALVVAFGYASEGDQPKPKKRKARNEVAKGILE